MEFEVLIVGSDVNAYYLARCTHEAYNKKCYMLIKDHLAYTDHSKIINHIYNPNIWEESSFVNAINDFADTYKSKRVLVISSNETYAEFLVKNKDSFRQNIVFNYPDFNVIQNLINKEKFYKEYCNMGLYFPKTIYFDLSANNKLHVDFTYPVIIKPANVVLFNHVSFPGKKKIYKIYSEDELNSVIQDIKNSDYNDVLVIQEYIPGDDSHLFDSVVYCDSNSNVKLISFAQIGLQEHNPNMVGNAAVVINGFNSFGVDTSEMIKSIKHFMERIHYRGFAEFDLKYDARDGKFKVLEINARQGRCSYYISPLGYNLVKILVDDLVFHKDMNFSVIDKKIMLTFVNKKIIRQYISNSEFRKEALRLYKQSVNPLKYNKDFSIYRSLLYIKRDLNYKKSYADYKW